jgi:hypothetical protein
MAGYSSTPLSQKLGIRAGSRVCLVNAPGDLPETLGPLPEGAAVVSVEAEAEAEAEAVDVIVCFVAEPAEVPSRFLELKPRLAWTGGLWFAWPKKRPGHPGIIGENTIRDSGLAAGLVDNKVCAIDDHWSGLRFVWRLEDRPRTAAARSRAR